MQIKIAGKMPAGRLRWRKIDTGLVLQRSAAPSERRRSPLPLPAAGADTVGAWPGTVSAIGTWLGTGLGTAAAAAAAAVA